MCNQHLLSLEIDGLGTVLNCVLLSFLLPTPHHPSPVSEGAGQGAWKDTAFHCAGCHCLSPLCSTCLDRLRTLPRCSPGQERLGVRGYQRMVSAGSA